MNFKMTNITCGLLAVAFSALAVMLAAAADAPPELTCNVTKTPDGYLHQLSRSSDCDTCWEDKDGGVLARKQDYDKNKVQSLTNQSLTSKLCHDNINYASTCSSNTNSTDSRQQTGDNRLTYERAHCTYTCSSPISDPQASQPIPVNPVAKQNLTWQILLGVVVVVVVGVGVGVLTAGILYIRKKKACRPVVNSIEEQEVMVEIPDVN
ncbi:uncharacterized protein LOC117560567 [Gymnodraco acuticeps]|uniref:Uncharacterized protein LOC117560567 n=1 Tax=Gymnodraco acuticeps TaxID=8218 RepID=A0A6P8X0C4_GYMAC|nr:uncharacterized protein LOC117560567 [Gymnodraco acuticeps]